ncbi:type VII secretion protein EccB [Mycobacterium triplex]|uniref:Type VII secretion protein EccB n=1 Tax=Mycobacterium triplex TaxID=47839 RepID=A0A024JU04_9MYCO|nr:type VII secretion protein EccB [Mycobacterium triplex]ORX02492.1 type VII secretion protein EccB [Mycobacterium triplex]CDO87106.1 type VII secretion protein EccB, Actinobacterial [Mycobacterium triplex]
MPHQPATWAHISGHRFLLRRIERALRNGDTATSGEPLRARTGPLTVGCVLAAITVAGCAFLGLLRPQARLDHAQIVMGKDSGALFVRVGDTWHPVLNLASARLVAATDANPRPVPESELRRTKRGPLLGIPGAPQLLAAPLSGDDAGWTICDTDGESSTTVVVGRIEGPSVHRLTRDQALLVAAGTGAPAYLLYDGQRAVVDLADTAVVRALRLEGRAPLVVSQSLLNAVPEAPPITTPRIRGAGGKAAGLADVPVGSVLRITRGDGDEYYAVLSTGVQRIGQVAADLLRFGDSRGSANIIAVAPDLIRGAPIVDTLPVRTFPEVAPRAAGPSGRPTTVCVSSGPGAGLLTAAGLPLPAGQAPVSLSQADGRGPALDAVYLPPGRSAYVRAGARYLVTDTGVRFAIHDDDAAHDLGLQTDPVPVPWPMLAVLPSGPELSRANASVARDVVAGSS